MTLELKYVEMGHVGAEYTVTDVEPQHARYLEPITLRIAQRGFVWQDYLSTRDAPNKAENPHLRDLPEAVRALPEVS